MSTATATPSRPPRLRRALRGALLAASPLVLVVVLLVLAVDLRPRIANPGPPDATAASHTRDVAESLRTLVATRAADGRWSATEA